MSARGSAAADDDSKSAAPLSGVGAHALTVLVLGLAGALLLALTEVSTVVSIEVGGVVVHAESGADRHNWALLVLAVGAVPLTLLAALAANRATAAVAAGGLALLGLAALLFWGVGDLPDTSRTGEFGVRYEAASAAAGTGLWLELAAAFALLAAATATLLRTRAEARRARRRPARPSR